MRTNPWKTKDADAAETRNINYFCYVFLFRLPAQAPLMTIGCRLASDKPRAGIFEESMVARNRGGIGLSYRPAGYIGWRNSFLGSDSWAP
jgi:hypothetical protein